MNATYGTRHQIEVYRFGLLATVGIPLLAIFFQTFVSSRLAVLNLLDLPLLVTIFFAVGRRNQIAGLLTGGLIGIVQDGLTHHPIGIYGIAKTVIGFLASSIGGKIDVENPGSRLLMTFAFFLIHQVLYFNIARGLVGQPMGINWSRELIAGVANALLAVPLFALLDRFKQRG